MEEKKDEEDSTLNEGEAEVAIAHAKRLVQSGVQASDIGIITPYAAQAIFFFWLNNFMHSLQIDIEYSEQLAIVTTEMITWPSFTCTNSHYIFPYFVTAGCLTEDVEKQ